MKQGTPRAATRLSILVGVCLAASFAGVALIQNVTDEEEAWDTVAFWPFALGGGLLLGAVFVRSARSAFFVGGTFAASILVASFALSRDDQGANFGSSASCSLARGSCSSSDALHGSAATPAPS